MILVCQLSCSLLIPLGISFGLLSRSCLLICDLVFFETRTCVGIQVACFDGASHDVSGVLAVDQDSERFADFGFHRVAFLGVISLPLTRHRRAPAKHDCCALRDLVVGMLGSRIGLLLRAFHAFAARCMDSFSVVSKSFLNNCIVLKKLTVSQS